MWLDYYLNGDCDLYQLWITYDEIKENVKRYLSDTDKNSIIDIVLDNVSIEDLGDIFYDRLIDDFEHIARMKVDN